MVERLFENFRSCRLCLRVSVAVFLAILVVEAAILFFSVQSYERNRQLEVEREALVLSRALLQTVAEEPDLAAAIAELGPRFRDSSALVGLQVFGADGSAMGGFGALPSFTGSSVMAGDDTQRQVVDQGAYKDILWPPSRTHSAYWVAARSDTSEVAEQVTAFIFRIVGLVLIITLFVTAVTLIVLERLILRPLRSLNQGLHDVGLDPRSAGKQPIEQSGYDEMRDVTEAFNQLSNRLGAAFQEIDRQNADLSNLAQRQSTLRDKAEAANRAKSVLLSTLSHEIRTPMTGVLGFANLLMDSDLKPDQRENLGVLKRSVESLIDVINDVLDLARLEEGQMPLNPVEVSMTSLMEDVTLLPATQADKKGLDFRIDLDPGLPTIVLLDPLRLRQVLVNLLSNALKFTEQGGIAVRVGLTEQAGSRGVLAIAVSDTGIGIDEVAQRSLFQRYVQANPAISHQFGGTGLGLSICQHLCSLWGGEISVTSAPDQGATFSFTVPVEIMEIPEVLAVQA